MKKQNKNIFIKGREYTPEELKKYTERLLEPIPETDNSGDANPKKPDTNDFIHIPSINLYVGKQRILQNNNWFDSHKELQKNNQRMLILPEFLEFLKYLKSQPNNQEYQHIYKDIIEVREPWRAEWIDADFKTKGNDLYINYNHILDSNQNLIPQNSEILDKNTLMEDKTPGISLDDLLSNHTVQGLPNNQIKSGDLYYWYLRNERVARFNADSDRAILYCNRDPSDSYSDLGVRGVQSTQKNLGE